jgi:PIN domain nuclease of toxin-antitoxin system
MMLPKAALLDTHTFIWWVTNDAQRLRVARETIGNGSVRLFFSAASAWEIAIKVATGKLSLPEPPQVYIPSRLVANGFEPLSIEIAHTLQTYHLPLHHRDPFDRILIAQSQVEGLPLLTVDSAFVAYGVETIW